jgi:DNA repair exonuclease SbcCD ATPase subunit
MPRPLFTLLTAALIVALFLVPHFPGEAVAASTPAKGVEHQDRGQQMERVKRFLQMTLDDFNLYKQLAEEDIGDLEKKLDDIPPLEPAQREADLLSLLDTYYSYLDWVKDRIEELEGDIEQLSPDSIPGSEFLENSLREIAASLEEMAKILEGKIDRFDSERKRLVELLEHRRLLAAQIDELENRLVQLHRNRDDNKQGSPDIDEHTKKVKAQIVAVRNELSSLPTVDEDMIAHYLVVTELGKGEAELIGMLIYQYDMLRQLAPLLPRDTGRFAGELEKGIRGTVRGYESEINLLKRRIEMLDKSRSRITPAGTLRETERLQELSDIYEKRGIRYNDLVNRLRIRIGTWEAEAAGIGPPVR